MDTIKFANGAVYDCSFLSTIPDGTAFVALSGISFLEAASIFSNPDMVKTMEYADYILHDYTTLTGLFVQPYGYQAVLKGGYDERKN